MKHSAPQTAKFRKFVRLLRPIVQCEAVSVESIAVGILERLWHTTIQNAPCGDIGKIEDDLIAELVGWHGNPQTLIDILIESVWLDPCNSVRLVVHDWEDHAPAFIKGNLKKHGREFIHPTKPDQTKPNLTQPNRQSPTSRGAKSTVGSRGSNVAKQGAKQNPDFARFWEVVHRKEGKAAASAAFQKAVDRLAGEKDLPKPEASSWLINRMKRFAKSQQAADPIKGTLHPATWLNQGRYDDDDSIWDGHHANGHDTAVRI